MLILDLTEGSQMSAVFSSINVDMNNSLNHATRLLHICFVKNKIFYLRFYSQNVSINILGFISLFMWCILLNSFENWFDLLTSIIFYIKNGNQLR